MSQMRGPLPKGFEPFEMQRMPKHIAIIMDGNGADGEYCTRQF